MGNFDDENNQCHSTNATVTSLKFKFPRKIFSDSNTSVPRKLRSAIRKRSCKSGSMPLPNMKRSNKRVNGVESLGRSSFNNSEQISWLDDSQRQINLLGISKDEEEVAETLFALAGMIPLDAVHENKKTSNESFEAKSLEMSRKQYSDPTPLSEDTVILKEERETTISSPNRLSERTQLNLNLKVYVPPAPFQIPPLLRTCDSTEQNRESMLNERKPEIYQFHKRESHISSGVTTDLAASEDRNNGTSIACRTLTSKLLPDPGVDGLSVWSSAIVFPSWLDNTSSSTSGSFNGALAASKVSCSINGGRKSWKRCIAHVCISRLIQGMQTSEGKYIQPLETDEMRPSQCPAAEIKDNLTATARHMFGPGAHKTKNCQVKEEGSSFSGCGDSKKQSYNFMSLSTGAGPDVNNGVNRMGITLEAKGHVLQQHSVGQHNTYVPCSMPQNHYPSFHHQVQSAAISGAPPSVPPQVNLQLPPYLGNPCVPAHLGTTTRSTQQPPCNQQQIWTSQLAAQFRPGPFLSSHITNWKNSTWEAHSVNHIQ